MAKLLVPCPECGAQLKLKDRKLLGRKGRCPRCEHRFVLEEPDEVELELANAPVREQPPVGTSARWVPDAAAATAQQPMLSTPEPAAAPTGGFPDFSEAPAAPVDTGGVSRLREIRRRNARRRNMALAAFGGLAIIAGVAAVLLRDQIPKPEPAAPPEIQVNADWEEEKQQLEAQAVAGQHDSPTDGDPIELKYVPMGTSVVVHLRPSDLWAQQRQFMEFIACLGPVGQMLDSHMQEFCRFAPAEIEEVTFCIILGARGSHPEYSAIIRLVEEQRRSELLKRFDGQRNDDYGHPVYLQGERAYLIADERTFAVGPASMAEEMVQGMAYPATTSGDVGSLVEQTDRTRHLTVVFEPQDLRIHQDTLVADNMVDALNHFVDWFGDDIKTVAWSMHLGDDTFFSEVLLRNQRSTSPARLQRDVAKRLENLPQDVLGMVELMDPRQSTGHRKIIGRFPAMTKAFAMGTRPGITDRYVQLTTVLPERAAPNLALATLLTWDESTRTDFSTATPAKPAPTSTLPDTIAARLKMKIEIDFRRTPLYEAFGFIGEEIKTDVEIDGDALKLAGFTQNMAQNVTLGEVPAIDGIRAILKNYAEERDPLAVVVDEAAKKIIVLTESVAKQRNLTMLPLE